MWEKVYKGLGQNQHEVVRALRVLKFATRDHLTSQGTPRAISSAVFALHRRGIVRAVYKSSLGQIVISEYHDHLPKYILSDRQMVIAQEKVHGWEAHYFLANKGEWE